MISKLLVIRQYSKHDCLFVKQVQIQPETFTHNMVQVPGTDASVSLHCVQTSGLIWRPQHLHPSLPPILPWQTLTSIHGVIPWNSSWLNITLSSGYPSLKVPKETKVTRSFSSIYERTSKLKSWTNKNYLPNNFSMPSLFNPFKGRKAFDQILNLLVYPQKLFTGVLDVGDE